MEVWWRGWGGVGGGNEDGDADWRAGRVNAAAAAGSQLCCKQPTAQTAEKYAELTSIRFKYCKGSTWFKGHLGIDVGVVDSGGELPAGKILRKKMAESEHFPPLSFTSGLPL